MAVMICRYAELVAKFTIPQNTAIAAFADEGKIAPYAKDFVYTLQRAGIINGFEDNRFAPDSSATRAECAKIVALFLAAVEAK